MQNADWWVDNAAHLLHHDGRAFPCDRDVEAMAVWNGHALLLSSDTDCLSIWDGEGLIRTARVGVYPQDVAVQGDTACVCGGADGRLHLLHLPELTETADFPLPGMPERVCILGESAYVMTLLADIEVETALMTLSLRTGEHVELARFAGLPGAICADESGLWVGVSEMVCHLPKEAGEPDLVIEGFGLVRHIDVQANGALVTDPVEGLIARITPNGVTVLQRGDTGQNLFPT